jgi:plasmid replication initiation protein
MNKSMTVTQDFALVNAKYKLTSSEMKFILTALTQLDSKSDTVLQDYVIKVSELEKKLQVEQNETRLKSFAKKLMMKPLEVPTSTGWIVANWFSDIEYVRGEAKFKVRFSEKLKPYLLELKERFISYNLKYILPMTSTYSVRIYQLLKEYEKLNKRYFSVDELQELLQVPKSYKIYNRFKEKVLQVAEKEINQYTDIKISIQEEKEGRKVARLVFRIAKAGGKNKELSHRDIEHFKKQKIYYNGEDWLIINVWHSKEHKNYLLVQMINTNNETLTDEIHLSQLGKMIDYMKNRPQLF